MMQLPFFTELEPARNVLLVGAGGGFDIYAGLPLYFWLKKAGKSVHLANLSFTQLAECRGMRPIPEVMKVTGATDGPSSYFPERALCQWLAGRGEPTPVYAIARCGVQPVLRAYRWLVDELDVDTLILVDGGTDILMRGDECGLGTPLEDISSLLAGEAVVGVERKFVTCIGFGVDAYHGVCHSLALENMASLIEDGGFLGSWSLTHGTEEARFYGEAVRHATESFPSMPSIVNHSVLGSVEGRFGDFHFTRRTEGSTLYLNPLMSLFWAFRLEALASRLLYRDEVLATDNAFQMDVAIDRFRDGLPSLRPWHEFPH